MNNKFHSFHIFCQNEKKIILFLCLDLFFLTLAFISFILQTKDSFPLTFLFLFIDILCFLCTVIIYGNRMLFTCRMRYYLPGSQYEATAFRMNQFYKLIKNNLFEYHFQPIINAATGEIFAYEALMRTNADDINMQPFEILDLAAKENCLYEIEKATLSNTLKIMNQYADIFRSKKLFINSISSHLLNDEDYNCLYKEYGHQFKNVVIEINKSTKLDEDSTILLKKRLKQTNCQLALYDYGTGNSNESNLLNTSPNFIKIDQSILRCINIDEKKQLLASNLISFANQNNIKVIAEGIESYDEFEYVINLGVDYIQGFYAAKPDPVLIDTMSEGLLKMLHDVNYQRLCELTVKKVYESKDESVLSPAAIALDRYTDIIINEKEITLLGNQGMAANISVIIPNNRCCHIILDQINLQGNDRPLFIIGKNCSIIMELIGDNFLTGNGIRLPETSDLTIIGSGNLTIQSDLTDRVGIGGTVEQAYGNITLASTGNVSVTQIGNKSVGIGGGQNPVYSLILLQSGNISVHTIGSDSVSIGSINGNARVEINNCLLKINTEAAKAVSIGSIRGPVDILSSGNIKIKCDGKYSVSIGALEEGDGTISILRGIVNIYYNAQAGSGIGCIGGKTDINILGGDIQIYAEGADITGIGDQTGYGKIHISSGIISVQLYAANAVPIGNMVRNVVIDGGNIQCDFPKDIIPMNSHQTPLTPYIITDKDEFRQSIETVSYSYEYKAEYSSRFPYVKVYLPDNIMLKLQDELTKPVQLS